jgi:hypothetical protein
MLAMTATLVAAAPAQGTFHLLKINEAALSTSGSANAQFVELFDPGNEPFPSLFGPFKLIAYDAGGNPVGAAQTLNTAPGYALTPRLLANQAVAGVMPDEPLSITLPQGAGQLCYVNGGGNSPVDCIGWGAVTHAVQAGEPTGSAPPDGQSLQRCGTGLVLAAPTPKAASNCSGGGGGGGGGGGTLDHTAPRASLGVAAPRLGKLISNGLGFTVRSNEAGRASATLELLGTTARKPPVVGSASVGIRRAGTVRLTVKLTRSARRRLGRVSKARLRLRVTVTDAARNARKLTKTLTSRK